MPSSASTSPIKPTSTPSCGPTNRCRCSIPKIRFRSAPWLGPMPSQRCVSCRTTSRTWRFACFPELAAEFKARFGREFGGLLRSYRTDDAEPRRRHGIGQRHDQRHDRRNASRWLPRRSRHAYIVPTVPDAGAARGAGRGETRRGDRKELAIGMGGQLANNVDLALRNTAGAPQVHSVVAGSADAQSRGRRCTSYSAARSCSRGKAHTFSTSTKRSSPRSCTTFAKYGGRDLPPRISCVT